MKHKRLLASILSVAVLLTAGVSLAFADTSDSDYGILTFNSVMQLGDGAVNSPNVTTGFVLVGGTNLKAGETLTNSDTNNGLFYRYGIMDGVTATSNNNDAFIAYEIGSTLTSNSYAKTIADFSSGGEGVYETAEAAASAVTASSYYSNYSEYRLFTDSVSSSELVDENNQVSHEISINFSEVDYTAPGIYQYGLYVVYDESINDMTINTNAGLGAANYYYEINVFVIYDEDTSAFVIDHFTMFDETSSSTSTDEEETSKITDVTNYYGFYFLEVNVDTMDYIDGIDAEDYPTSVTTNFTVTDVAKGSSADPDAEFSFATVAVSIPEDDETELVASEIMEGLVFQAIYIGGENDGETAGYFIVDDGEVYVAAQNTDGSGYISTDETELTIKLSSDEGFKVACVIKDMVFDVTISDTNNTGYDIYASGRILTSYTAQPSKWTLLTEGESVEITKYIEYDDFTVSVTIVEPQVEDQGDGQAYTSTNGVDFATVSGMNAGQGDDDGIIYDTWQIADTGVVLDLAPYAIIMVLALGAISIRFVRTARKTEE